MPRSKNPYQQYTQQLELNARARTQAIAAHATAHAAGMSPLVRTHMLRMVQQYYPPHTAPVKSRHMVLAQGAEHSEIHSDMSRDMETDTQPDIQVLRDDADEVPIAPPAALHDRSTSNNTGGSRVCPNIIHWAQYQDQEEDEDSEEEEETLLCGCVDEDGYVDLQCALCRSDICARLTCSQELGFMRVCADCLQQQALGPLPCGHIGQLEMAHSTHATHPHRISSQISASVRPLALVEPPVGYMCEAPHCTRGWCTYCDALYGPQTHCRTCAHQHYRQTQV